MNAKERGNTIKTIQTLIQVLIQVLFAGVALMVASSSQASLMGDTVTCASSMLSGLCVPIAGGVVGAGPEFGGFLLTDVGVSSISVTNLGAGNPDGPGAIGFGIGEAITLASLDDSAGDIVGISNFTTVGTTGIAASDVSFTAHSITFDIGGSFWALNAFASFDLVVRPSGVAEPGSLALLGLGAVGLALARRRKR